ncbi:MAG: Ig-like domain-containing protein [Candidatus Saganbacteria bacterium]|nr:Ig-like domain-containing protein [Candidatus Saganbacteria bacterium]
MKKLLPIFVLFLLFFYVILVIGCGSAGGGGGGTVETPTIVSRTPTLDATGISQSATLELTFSIAMQTTVATAFAKRADTHTAGDYIGTLAFSWSNGNKTLRITGITSWDAGAGKIVSLLASLEGFRSVQGRALAENSVLWRYTLAGTSHNLTNMFMLHHSVGANLIAEGGVRTPVISNYNTVHGTSYKFWDHGYNSDGLTDYNGNPTLTNYDIPGDNTNPDGLDYIFTSSDPAAIYTRNLIMSHEVIIIKSCFPNADMPDNATLQAVKDHFTSMRTFFDAHPEKLFIVMGIPPLHRLVALTDEVNNRARARSFANWLKTTYVSGHPNVVCFDLFGYLAASSTIPGGDVANALKYDYERYHVGDDDSHPNTAANEAIGPIFGLFIIDAAQNY